MSLNSLKHMLNLIIMIFLMILNKAAYTSMPTSASANHEVK